MASIGLRIAQDPYASQGMSLANTLARAIAPDPSKMMQMELMRERAQAQQLYQEQLRANMDLAQQKNVRDETLANSLVSERASTEAMNRQKTDEATAGQNARTAAAAPLAEVFKSRVPKPPLVLAPDILEPQLQQYETTTKAIDAMVPAIIQSGGNADQVGKAIQGIMATPEILYGKPDAVRRGATLQGNLPTETSVLAAGDNIGTDQKIAAEKAKPQTPIFTDQKDVRLVPDPSQPSGFRQVRVGDAGPAPLPGPFSGNTVEAQALNIINSIGPKIANGTATEDETRAYALADAHINKVHNYEGVQGGNKIVTPVVNRPAGFPAPEGATSAPTVIGENKSNLTEGVMKAREHLALMDEGEKTLSSMRPDALYSLVDTLAQDPTQEYKLGQIMEMLPDPKSRMLFQAFLMFGEGRLRGASGAAIPGSEWASEFAKFMPRANASQEEVEMALRNRRSAHRGVETNAFGMDPAALSEHRKKMSAWGIDIGYGDLPPAAPAPGAPPAAPPPAGRNWVFNPATGQVEEAR